MRKMRCLGSLFFLLALGGAGLSPEVGGTKGEAELAARLRNDITRLLWPSPRRALLMNKAYRVIVLEQSFRKGRAAVIAPIRNAHRKVEAHETTGVEKPLTAANGRNTASRGL